MFISTSFFNIEFISQTQKNNIFFEAFLVVQKHHKENQAVFTEFLRIFFKHSRHGRGVIIKQWYENSTKYVKHRK
jgi:hypothetical protein